VRKHLAVKISLSILGIVLIIILPLLFTVQQLFLDAYCKQAERNLLEKGQEYARLLSTSTGHGSAICRLSTNQVVIVNSTGTPIEKSRSVSHVHTPTGADLQSLQKALSGQPVIKSQYSTMFGATGALAIVPFGQGNAIQGAVVMFLSQNDMLQALSKVGWTFALTGFLAIALASGLAVILSNRLSQPLKRMADAAKRIGQGHYEIVLPVKGEDEIGQLSSAVNDMATNLRHLDTTRKEFLANVSHELRTPLTYIRGYSDLLQQGLIQSDEEKQRCIQTIHEESERIERMIQDLFALAQGDEGTLKIEKKEVDITKLIVTLMLRVQQRARDNHVTVTFTPERPCLVLADPQRIEQVLFNLLDNAIRFTPDGGNIQVLLHDEQDGVTVSISDTGIGIPEEELPYIWERLYRVEKSRSRVQGGTGLGLSIVKQIVELHGGLVHASSIEGEGSTISFTLPRH
jgi:two-component system, OmpR family, sensor histidine kinase BaeS